ncbi:MAG TPA: MFS transporter [Acidimicrobiales bacterium]
MGGTTGQEAEEATATPDPAGSTPATTPPDHRTTATPDAAGSGAARRALRSPTFRRVLLGAFASNVGTWMHNVVLGAIAYDLTESSSFVGLMVFAQLGPMLLLSTVGGVLADRFDRTRLLVTIVLSQLLLSLVLAVVTAADRPDRLALLGVTFAIGIGQALYAPAFTALLPELVAKEDIAGAVSLNSAQMNTARVVGPVIGAFLYSAVGASTVFVANASSYLFVVLAVGRVRLPRAHRDGTASRGLRALGDGLRAARSIPVVARCLVVITLYSLISLPFVGQFPVLAERNLDIGTKSTAYGVLYACFGVGAVLGALSIGTVLSRQPKSAIVRWALVGFAVTLAVLALLRSPAPAYPVVTVVGFTYLAVVTALMTMVQEQLDNRIRGRVMALWIMGWGGTVPIGNLLAGPLIEATSITAVLLGGAAFAVFLAAYVRPAPAAAADPVTVDRATVDPATVAPTPAGPVTTDHGTTDHDTTDHGTTDRGQVAPVPCPCPGR